MGPVQLSLEEDTQVIEWIVANPTPWRERNAWKVGSNRKMRISIRKFFLLFFFFASNVYLVEKMEISKYHTFPDVIFVNLHSLNFAPGVINRWNFNEHARNQYDKSASANHWNTRWKFCVVTFKFKQIDARSITWLFLNDAPPREK